MWKKANNAILDLNDHLTVSLSSLTNCLFFFELKFINSMNHFPSFSMGSSGRIACCRIVNKLHIAVCIWTTRRNPMSWKSLNFRIGKKIVPTKLQPTVPCYWWDRPKLSTTVVHPRYRIQPLGFSKLHNTVTFATVLISQLVVLQYRSYLLIIEHTTSLFLKVTRRWNWTRDLSREQALYQLSHARIVARQRWRPVYPLYQCKSAPSNARPHWAPITVPQYPRKKQVPNYECVVKSSFAI